MEFLKNKKTLIIAEMACSYDGDFFLAKKIIFYAAKSKSDAIKFQIFFANELVDSNHEKFNFYKKQELTIKEWKNLITYAKNQKLKVFVDIFGIKSAKAIEETQIDGYKLHSSDITNPHILNYLSNLSLPILLSTAGTRLNEINEAIKILVKKPKKIILMHGYQGYPTKIQEMNLDFILELKQKFGLPVGISDHTSGSSEMAIIVPLLGIAKGVSVVEKHITLDRSKKGIDYFSSLNPDEFKKLVRLIRQTEKSLGTRKGDLSVDELRYRLNFKKNPISKKIIRKNEKLQKEFFDFKRTKLKKEPLPYYDFIGKKSSKQIAKNKIITKEVFGTNSHKIAAVIACRVDSKRLYAKPLQNVGKFTILHLLLEQIKKSKFINDIVLAISNKPGNEAFIDFAHKNNLKFVIGDDKDVLQRLIDGAKFVGADIVFRKTSENPFIYWEGIDRLIENHLDGKYDYSSFGEKLPLGAEFEIINRKALEISHKLGTARHRSELCALYIMENQKKFKIQKSIPPKEILNPNIRLTVDTPEDLLVAQKIHKSLGKNDVPIPLEKIIAFLEKNPDIVRINNDIPIGVSRLNL